MNEALKKRAGDKWGLVGKKETSYIPLFNLALFLQDNGFDPPYGSNHLLIVNLLYIYTETSALKEIL